MLRIVILEPDRGCGYALFQTAQIAVRKCNVKCELSHTADAARLFQNLSQDKKYYDILLLNPQDTAALRIARELRRVNMTAAIMFTGMGSTSLNELLKFRPSAILESGDAAQLTDALTFCIGEQIRSKQYFTIRNKDALLRIHFEDISHIESRQRIAVMYAGGKAYEFYAKLGDIYPSLPQDVFVRCHQSYIVNMGYVRTLDKTARCFHLLSGETVEISKASYAQTLSQYTAYLKR